ncbi:DUF481 domain-containing protein [Thalassotalea ponticola]|uniref:DUF481 domain-containing protein n=1 Tax=Thalassotalea ponticola TaxID=1523392 RepID=UPI0025B2D0B7|nr:DUF481 domain-containing protein [Thalassotalea ponticola]MDN3653550.1 DUF481 domain-containing protein [Thalassotalea ponticola]
MRLILLLMVLLVASTGANGQQSEPQEEPKLWSGTVDFGYTNLTGNTEESTMAGRVAVSRENKPWKWDITGESLFSENGNTRTAEKYAALSRLAYNFTEKNYVFGRATYETDKFSGFDYQATAIAGFGWNLYDEETFQWDIELGAGYRKSKVDDPLTGDDQNEPIVTASTLIDYQFSQTTTFHQYLSLEKGSDTDIVYSRSELRVQAIENLAFKFSYNIKHTSDVPVGSENTDTETIVSLSYAF